MPLLAPAGDYFTIDDLRTLPDMDNPTRYPEALCQRAADAIIAIIEREVGTSFVGRTRTDVLDGTGSTVTLLHPFVLSVTGVNVGGVAQVGPFTVSGGVLDGTYAKGTKNVEVTYLAGYSETPPADIREAALWGTRARLLQWGPNAGINDRQTSLSTDVGVIGFVVAGPDRPTGYPEVDAVINGWKARLDHFGFA